MDPGDGVGMDAWQGGVEVSRKPKQERGPDGGAMVDLTILRLGTVVRRWKYRDDAGVERVGEKRIVRCPACGKKGEPGGSILRLGITEYTHRYEIVMGLFSSAVERCEIDSPLGPLARAWQQVLNGMKRAKAKPALMAVAS